MTVKTLTLAATLLIVAASTDAALAQARRGARTAAAPAASAPAGPQVNPVPGPPIAGLCAYNDQLAISLSSVGKAAAARMQQLRQQAQAEVGGEQTTLQADARALEAKRASLTQPQLQQQAAPLQQRAEQLDRKAQIRSRELDVTTQKALGQIHNQIGPIVQSVAASRNCSVILTGETVLAVNPSMDLTQAVTQQLNTRMSTISFDREHLDTQAAAGR